MSKGLLAWALGWHGVGYVLSLVTSLVMTWGVFFSAPQFFRFTEHEGGGKAEPGAKRTLSRWKQVLSTYKGGRKWAVVWLFGSRMQYPERGLLDILKLWTRSAECSAWSNANTFNWPLQRRREELGFCFSSTLAYGATSARPAWQPHACWSHFPCNPGGCGEDWRAL